MLNYVPTDNKLINGYRQKPESGPRLLTTEMQTTLEEANKPQKGGKRKAKVGPSEPAQTPKKKVKKAARKPRSPSPIVEEDSESHIVSNVQRTEQVEHETEDTTTTWQPMVS